MSTDEQGAKDKSIIRAEKTKNYSVIINEVARRRDISARAKGIYYYVMTLPDDWKFYKSELYKHFTEGRDALNKAFKELEEAGYITKEKIHGNKGKFDGWSYTIHESVQNVQSSEALENRKSENPKSANPSLLNTDLILNTNNTNIGDDSLQEKEKKEREGSEATAIYNKIRESISTLDDSIIGYLAITCSLLNEEEKERFADYAIKRAKEGKTPSAFLHYLLKKDPPAFVKAFRAYAKPEPMDVKLYTPLFDGTPEDEPDEPYVSPEEGLKRMEIIKSKFADKVAV